jgi:nickel transport protein
MANFSYLKIILITLILFSILTSSGEVSAHRIHLDAEVSNYSSSSIQIEAYYGDGKPVKNGEVKVLRANGDTYTTGKTDDDGRFSFQINTSFRNETLSVEVLQAGHKVTKEITIGESINEVIVKGGDADAGLPTYQTAIAGLGYLLGIAGLASLYMAYKIKRQQQPAQNNSRISSGNKKHKKLRV